MLFVYFLCVDLLCLVYGFVFVLIEFLVFCVSLLFVASLFVIVVVLLLVVCVSLLVIVFVRARFSFACFTL